MSVYNVHDILEAGEKALSGGNTWAAFAVALMLPSICSAMVFTDKEKYMNFRWNDKNDHSKGKEYTTWKDKKRYIDFCKEFLKNTDFIEYDHNHENRCHYTLEKMLGENYFKVLYSMRCGIVHEGVLQDNGKPITINGKLLILEIGKSGSNVKGNYQVVSAKDICECIFEQIKNWIDAPSQNGVPVCPCNVLKYGIYSDAEHNNSDKSRFWNEAK